MTDDNQLRISCAEAMGWKYWHLPGDRTQLLRPETKWPAESFWQKQGFKEGDGRPECPLDDVSDLPNPLTSYDDAFALVENAREEGWDNSAITRNRETGNWIVSLSHPFSSKMSVSSTDPDLRRAICLAFLKLRAVA